MQKKKDNPEPNDQNRSLIKIGCWNIQGLISKDNDKTKDQYFQSEIRNFDILALVETHVVEGQGNIPSVIGYETHFFNRNKHAKARHGSGGIAILVKPQLRKGIKFLPLAHKDYIWIKLDKTFFGREQDVYLCAAYVPPPNSTYSQRLEMNILDAIESDIYKYKNMGEIILLGDLNGRVGLSPDFIANDSDKHLPMDDDYKIDCTQQARNSQDKHTDNRGKHILEICIAAQLRLLNGRKIGDTLGYYTSHQYNGSSVVDYAICSATLLDEIPYFKVHKFLGTVSDHCMISFTLLSKISPHQETSISLKALPKQFKWSEDSKEKFQAALKLPVIQNLITNVNFKIANISDPNNADEATEELTSIFAQTAKLSLKFKGTPKPTVNKTPWKSAKIKQLEREVHKKGQAMIKYQTGNYRNNFFCALKRLRKERKYARRHYFNTQVATLKALQNSNPRKFWQVVQELKEGNAENNADKIQPGVWYNYLMENNKSKSSAREDKMLEEIVNLTNKSFSELDFKITRQELKTAVNKLKNNKASGLDLISNEMLKSANEELYISMLNLFNKIYSGGYFPNCWSTGFISNIHKKGSYLQPENYRGITIISNMGKLFNSILAIRLQDHLEKHKLLTPEQIGFTKGASTADHIFTLKTLINKYTANKSQKLYTCFVDFRQAFDRVWHMGLFYKLSKLEINSHFLQIIRSMYNKTKLCVKTHGQLTEFFHSNIGVRQGDSLSPTLFNLYINDLPNYINNMKNSDPVKLGSVDLNCLMYADDVILLSTSLRGLQRCIEGVKQFSEKWHLDINLNKTKAVIFNKSGTPIKEVLKYGDATIECVNSYTYLGIDFNISGSFENAIKRLYEKGSKALYKLYKLTDQKYDLNTLLYIFDCTIAPILLYGSEVWGIEGIKNSCDVTRFMRNLEDSPICKLETKFCKHILQVKRNTSTVAIRGELGRHPLLLKAISRSIKYFNQIKSRPENQLVKQALNESLNLKSSWYSKLANVTKLLNIPLYSQNNSKSGLKQFVKRINKDLESKYTEYWHKQLNSATSIAKNRGGNKLRTYANLKQDFSPEKYLNHIENQSYRKSLTQLRLSSHPLNIEALRGTIHNPDNRLCEMCSLNKVEDEKHFVTECALYSNLRMDLYKNLESNNFLNLSSENKFIWILTNEDKTICKLVGKFLTDCFSKRKERLSP